MKLYIFDGISARLEAIIHTNLFSCAPEIVAKRYWSSTQICHTRLASPQ
jgi:hypothetical protein